MIGIDDSDVEVFRSQGIQWNLLCLPYVYTYEGYDSARGHDNDEENTDYGFLLLSGIGS